MNYAGMYNWVQDLPTGLGEKKVFIDCLSTLPPNAKILEVGTYAGTSIITMLRYANTAYGTVIDNWDLSADEQQMCEKIANKSLNDVEKIFDQNVTWAGMENRIEKLKGASSVKLRELWRSGCKFDLVYVDGSHKCLDCHADMIFAWELLNCGGILIVDDFIWGLNEMDSKSVLDIPYHGVLHFLDNYGGEYRVLWKEYRVFLQKLI